MQTRKGVKPQSPSPGTLLQPASHPPLPLMPCWRRVEAWRWLPSQQLAAGTGGCGQGGAEPVPGRGQSYLFDCTISEASLLWPLERRQHEVFSGHWLRPQPCLEETASNRCMGDSGWGQGEAPQGESLSSPSSPLGALPLVSLTPKGRK